MYNYTFLYFRQHPAGAPANCLAMFIMICAGLSPASADHGAGEYAA